MKWKIEQMSKYAPGYTGPMTTAGPVKPKTTGPKTLTPIKPKTTGPMPTPVKPRGPLAVGPKPLPNPRGPRGTGPNDAPIRPKGPKTLTPGMPTPVKTMPPKGAFGTLFKGMSKGGSVKKGMSKGGMAKKGKC